jgi:hypothetical protein
VILTDCELISGRTQFVQRVSHGFIFVDAAQRVRKNVTPSSLQRAPNCLEYAAVAFGEAASVRGAG